MILFLLFLKAKLKIMTNFEVFMHVFVSIYVVEEMDTLCLTQLFSP